MSNREYLAEKIGCPLKEVPKMALVIMSEWIGVYWRENPHGSITAARRFAYYWVVKDGGLENA